MSRMREQVYVVGTGITRFGDRFDRTFEDLVVDAATEAMADAGIGPDRIEAGWIGTYLPGAHGGKAAVALADPLKLYGRPITRVENFCATGTDAVRTASLAIAAGACDVALVVGAEKLKDRPGRGIPRSGAHPVFMYGTTAPGMFAFAANRYMHRYGMGREMLAKVAVKNHYNGARNPLAHLRKEVTEEAVLRAPMVAEPFGLFDCCPTTDGAAAVVLASHSVRQEFQRADPIAIHGVGLAVTSGKPWNDPGYDYLGFPATTMASQQAYSQAGITARDVSFAEVHDCFTMTEILNYEDLGFAEKGNGWRLVDEGRTALGGDIPVNPSGGLKSFGHPIGASGVRMVAEVARQLRGECGEHQVKSPSWGVAHNVGGPGAVSCVLVLGHP